MPLASRSISVASWHSTRQPRVGSIGSGSMSTPRPPHFRRLERRRHLHQLVKRPPQRLSDGCRFTETDPPYALLGSRNRMHWQPGLLGDVGLASTSLEALPPLRQRRRQARAVGDGRGRLAWRHATAVDAASARASCAIDNRDGGGVCLMGMTPRDRRRGQQGEELLSCNDG